LQESNFLTAQTITGGKYERLLIKKIGWRTDSSNPNSITFVLTLKQVIVTVTETTTYSPLPAEKRAKNQTSKTVKSGEKSSKTLSTTDKTASVQDKAKAQAAKKQGDEVKKDNRTAAANLLIVWGYNMYLELPLINVPSQEFVTQLITINISSTWT
jgi:hypothetical protein